MKHLYRCIILVEFYINSYMFILTLIVVVESSLCLTKQHAMKTYWRSGGIASPPGKEAPGAHLIGGWVGPSRHGVEEKNSQPLSGIELRSSSP
jgi:hypothetical protein